MKPGRPVKGQETSTTVLSVRLDQEALEALVWMESEYKAPRADVVRYALLSQRAVLRNEPLPPEPGSSVSTWVYFIQRGNDGPIKIGVSGNPHRRLQQLQGASAEPLLLLATVVGSAAHEQHLHDCFAAFRLEGEWFSPAQELLAHIESVK